MLLLGIAVLFIFAIAVAFIYYQNNSQPASTGLSLYEKAMLEAEEKKKAAAAATTTNEKEENPFPGGNLTIYFGSQTGTAEEFAKTLEGEAKTNGFNAKVVDLEDFEPEDMQNDNIAIFAMATYGEGDPPSNANNFVSRFKKFNQPNKIKYSIIMKIHK